jgi:hypothetical protein
LEALNRRETPQDACKDTSRAYLHEIEVFSAALEAIETDAFLIGKVKMLQQHCLDRIQCGPSQRYQHQVSRRAVTTGSLSHKRRTYGAITPAGLVSRYLVSFLVVRQREVKSEV